VAATRAQEARALVYLFSRGGQVSFTARATRQETVDVGLFGVPTGVRDRGVGHRFTLAGFSAALRQCG
jgi:hypothetical protein